MDLNCTGQKKKLKIKEYLISPENSRYPENSR